MSAAMQFTTDQILKLADEHIKMFSRRVGYAREGRKGYRLGECEGYLAIWTSIAEKGGTDLNSEEEGEVMDAFLSEEYTDILGTPEDQS